MLAAQLIHAAGESSPGGLPEGTHAIALAARDSAHLDEIAQRLINAGVAVTRIIEDWPPFNGELLALGIAPSPRSSLRRLLSSLPLVRDSPDRRGLHACPWCASEPVATSTRFEVEYGCPNDDCPIQPRVYDHTEELARAAWERRTP